MSNQQDPHDEFGGFGESDDQTFLHDSSKSSSAKTSIEDSSPSAKTEETEYPRDAQSGFISYVKPDISEEEEQSSLRKVGMIAFFTIVAAAILWMILPSKQNGEADSRQIVAIDTIPEKQEEVEENTQQKTTLDTFFLESNPNLSLGFFHHTLYLLSFCLNHFSTLFPNQIPMEIPTRKTNRVHTPNSICSSISVI